MSDLCLFVKGDFACFTRPEMKVERVSYDIPTPSAMRAVFESILWKPAIRWRMTKIEILRPIRWISVRRNEVGAVASVRNDSGLFIEEERQQRAGLFLRDVAYRFHGRFEMTDKAGQDETPEKFLSMFARRAAVGQCVTQPYLGCREFSCDFELVPKADLEQAILAHPPIAESRDLGWMLYDMEHHTDNPQRHVCDERCRPLFFRAEMTNGQIDLGKAEVRG
jgi:CRISPR-associated protein Cas5d